jgi:5,10-methylenetetrahydrofolate reductase
VQVLVEELPGHPPAVLRAAVLADTGAQVVCVVPVGDRNRVAVEGDLAALVDLGVAEVLVDAASGRVGDLTALEATDLARGAGLRVSVRGPDVTPAPVRTAGGCPKQMTYGPCGGVGATGTCEVSVDPCVFVGVPLPVRWTGGPSPAAPPPTAAAREVRELMARRPLIVTGFPAAPMDSASVAACAEELRDAADCTLAGDSGRARVQYPPSYRARLMAAAGLRVWSGVNCRDRDRDVLQRELLGLHEVGVAGVHCVTGDHTTSGDRPDAAPVFDLEATTLLPRARAAGLLTSFAESPSAPPVDIRAARIAEKVRAGGELCWLQYCGEIEDVHRFVEETAAAAGRPVPTFPGVPLLVDHVGARLLADFAAAVLPIGYVEEVLAARDPEAAGVRVAIELGRQLLEVPGVAGVVIAGGARPGHEVSFARSLATVARELGGGSS